MKSVMSSIKAKLLAISLILLICLGAVFSIYLLVTTRDYQRLRLVMIRRTIKYEAERANRVIAEIERSAIQLSINGLLFYDSQSDGIGQISVLEFIRSFPTAIGGGFWFEPYAYNEDSFRVGIHAFFDKTEDRVRLDYISDDYDYHSMDWYRGIVDRIQSPYEVVWIWPYIDDSTFSLVTTAGAGIFNDYGDLIGISIIDWELEGAISALSEIKPTENSIVVLYDSTHDGVITNTSIDSFSFPHITPADTSGAGIPRIIESASRTWQDEYDVSLSLVMIDNIRNVAFERIMNNGWHLLIYAPMDEIFLESDQRNRLFTLTLIFTAIIILCLAYFIISKIIYIPIKKLTSSVAHISLGNLDVRAEVSGKDELGTLAQAFNKMTIDLQESIEAYTREHTEKERIRAELSIAAGIQSSMLPCIFPPFPERNEFDIYATMQPAKEVGGDFYDFFFVDKNILAIIIADVSGKGVPAALFMAIAKALISNNASSNKSPREVFEAVNNTLCENNETVMFVTAFMGYYNTQSKKFLYVNAGHNPPLLKKNRKDYILLETKPCKILGWEKNLVYREEEISFEPGDTLYLYTDGVTEAINADGVFFTEERLLKVLNKVKDSLPRELLIAVTREIKSFAEGVEQADDITMLALEINR